MKDLSSNFLLLFLHNYPLEESAQPADPILLILTQLMKALLAPQAEPASKLYFVTFLGTSKWDIIDCSLHIRLYHVMHKK